ncbi:MAG: glycine cleavage system protein H [Deltaproteobacteria bacterium]|nr:glycine cleavage system protein H [Deltaproteobacteria bacterium]
MATKITGFNFSQKECVWMRAKVVPTKYCDNVFDCTTCAFDKGMAKKMAREDPDVGWSTRMFELPGEDQRCRHALTGRAPQNKLCARNFECSACPYDQMLDDMIQVDHTLFGPPQYLNAHGYLVPRDYYIHKGHGWARIEYGGRVRIGLDDFGNRLVGPVDKMRLPSLGTRFKIGEESFILDREAHEVGVRVPVSGAVTAVNQKLLDYPKCTNQDPYSAGWVLLIDPMELRSDLKDLNFGVDSVKFIEAEAERLLSMITDDPAAAAATGGEPITDVYGAFKDIGWERLVKSFI